MPETPGTHGAHLPQWVRITDELRASIATGYYAPGSLLPSYPELMQTYGVSTTTARKALSQLAIEGLAEAKRGRGTIVVRPQPRRALPARRYRPADGPAPDLTETVISSGPQTPPHDIAHLLGTDPDRPIHHHQVTAADAHGVVELRTTYTTDQADERSPRYVSESVSAGQIGGPDAERLAARPGSPILIRDTIVYDATRTPITVIRSAMGERARLTDYYEMP